MKSFASAAEFQACIKDIRQYKEGYLTNYFVNNVKTELWISRRVLSYKMVGKTLFVERLNRGFSNLYYISTHVQQLNNDMQVFADLRKNNMLIVDILGKNAEVENVLPAFTSNGFNKYTVLTRMSRPVAEYILKPTKYYSSFRVRNASEKDLSKVEELFSRYFDKHAEQIPSMEDLLELQGNNQIIIAGETDQQVAGFMIYEMNGKTGYLRYWFVHPDFREMKIGSLLLNKFFELCQSSTRQLFWVIDSNENAIKRYEHYGFRKEDMKDYVLTNKQITYEG